MANEIVGKVISLVEIDVDEYAATSFEFVKSEEDLVWGPLDLKWGTYDLVWGEGATSALDWTAQWSANLSLLGISDDEDYPSGQAIRFTGGASALRSAFKFNKISNSSFISVLAGMIPRTSNADCGIVIKGSGSAGSETGYMFTRYSSTSFVVYKWSSGSSSQLIAETAIDSGGTWGVGDPAYVLFEAINVGSDVLVRVKVWIGTLADEPSLYTASATDSSSALTSDGFVGISTVLSSTVFDLFRFRARSSDPENAVTHRFSMNEASYVPSNLDTIPNLINAELTPSRISLGSNLGQRAVMSLTFTDHPSADLGEGYDRGSFWGKMRARNLFRRGQDIRLKQGLLGYTIGEFETRNYIIDHTDGPDANGQFSIVAQDVLKLADNDRAQCPVMSNGFLLSGINDTDTSATLSPTGIGNLEYPASGYLAIGGEEIVSFTRSGDTLTITRGQFGTVAQDHEAQDRVQVCVYYNAGTADDILSDLFTTYADIDSSYIPASDWATEVSTYLNRLYTRLIAEPTGVNKLASELVEQAGLSIWFDDESNELKLKVLRSIDTTVHVYDESEIQSRSLTVRDQPDTRLTQVWTYYGVRNPLDSLTDPYNYRSQLRTLDGDAETEYGSAAIRKIFGTWIPSFGRTTAQRVNDILLGRFVVPPRRFTFDVPRYAGITKPLPGSGYRLGFQGSQDEFGDPSNIPIQVTRVNPRADRFSVEAEELRITIYDADDLTTRVIIFDSSINDVNLKDVHDSIYPELTEADVANYVELQVTVNAGVIIGSTSTATPAFLIPSDWPAGLQITLTVNGRIQGRGGDGGRYGIQYNYSQPHAGEPGGTALDVDFPIDLDCTSAEIWGGGGGGAGGYLNLQGQVVNTHDAGGGGGGAGTEGGTKGVTYDIHYGPYAADKYAQDGTADAGGDGGFKADGDSNTNPGADGGGPGLAGADSTDPGPPYTVSGGAAGNAIEGLANINFIGGSGDRRGGEV